jgi:hypothetical protein
VLRTAGYGPKGKDGASIKGDPGANGRGVSSATVNGSGRLIVTYTDGQTTDAGMVKGADGSNGLNGASGRGITGAVVNGSGRLVLTYSDGSTADLGVVVGSNGTNGSAGTRGSIWAVGSGSPSAAANVGDMYLDTATGDVWRMN